MDSSRDEAPGAPSAARRQQHILLLDLDNDPDAIAAYRAWHRPGGPPAAVTRSIREAGIVAMDIWLAGDRLVMVMETGPGFDAAAKARRDADDPDVRAWEALMDRYQRRLAFAPPGVKWVAAERIFALAEQP
jgi:L-rhamnose mutarotase